MKVFILAEQNYEGMDVKSVFSTKEKALNAVRYEEIEPQIFEFELDPNIEGVTYLNFPTFSLLEGGEFWTGGQRCREDVDLDVISFFKNTRGGMGCSAMGKTIEEAEARAREGIKKIDKIWQVCSKVEVQHPHPSCVCEWHTPYTLHRDINVCRVVLSEYLSTGKLCPGILFT